MDATARDLVGALLGGRYRLPRAIGRGGMGMVYEAEQVDLGRPHGQVAVRVTASRTRSGLAVLAVFPVLS